MDTAFSRGGSSRTATGGVLSIDHARENDQEAQERTILGAAESVFDRFCEQVCGSVLLTSLVHEGSVRVATVVHLFFWVLLYRPFCFSSNVFVELVVDG